MAEYNELDSTCGVSDEELTHRFKEAVRIENEIKKLKKLPIANPLREGIAVTDPFYSENNMLYLEKMMCDINDGKAHFAAHDLIVTHE